MRGTLATTVLALALAAGAAHAQAPTPADAALAEGRRLYDLQEWDQAIAKFKEAYRLRADAPALFNIAQSYRLKGDCPQAANFYKTFKRNFPKEKNIDKVEKFISEMEACAKAGPAKVDPPKVDPPKVDPPKVDPPVGTTGTPPPTTNPPTGTTGTPPTGTTGTATTGSTSVTGLDQPPPPAGKPGAQLRVAGLVTAGVGIAALGTGIVFGLKASSLAKDAEALGQGDAWDPSIQARGEKAQRTRTILFGVGGAALVAGGVMYFMGRKQGTEASG